VAFEGSIRIPITTPAPAMVLSNWRRVVPLMGFSMCASAII
jgi:hypothetical protein